MGAASAIREVLYSLWRLHVNWFGTQESAYLGRESLNRIHWVLVHTMNNDSFMRYAWSDAKCPQFLWKEYEFNPLENWFSK
ncbi:hypothetical protein POTOM_051889 [Populus tomentosa]|uniref:Uncharacterized protein n=1 Tax=Populus tomentosa TaxID=118781 RepID=A0A8X7Y2X2_POPTO|nr:hypothetical protein POTOM_051889 [Populus tomentosa]